MFYKSWMMFHTQRKISSEYENGFNHFQPLIGIGDLRSKVTQNMKDVVRQVSFA